MKNLILIFLFLCVSSSLLWAANGKKVKIYSEGLQVHTVKGIARIITEKGQEKECQLNDLLSPGSTLQTGPGAEVTLLAKDGDRYHIEEQSTIVVSIPIKQKFLTLFNRKKDSKKKASTIEMLKGKINVYVKPKKENEVKISTYYSILSVKGTAFSVEIMNDTLSLNVWEGIVQMEKFDGSHIDVLAGMQGDTKSWQARKISQDQQNKLKIEILDDLKEIEIKPQPNQQFNQQKFPGMDIKSIQFDPKKNATFNWSTYELEIEIDHPARNPSHQRSSAINDLPPNPPTR